MIIPKKWRIMLVIICAVSVVQHLAPIPRRQSKKAKITKRMGERFTLQSSAFASHGDIPVMFACDGKDISPPLRWQNPPLGTQSYALIMHDPDALGGAWTHWIVFNIPGHKRYLTQQVDVSSIHDAVVGTNSWREERYSGPCPPLKMHRYIFTLYALNIDILPLKSDARRKDVLQAMRGHILGKTQLMGKYQRPKNK